jgi:RNA polymerase sigma-70 factor, ECF subfamily
VTGPTDLTDRIIALLPRLRRFALTLTRHPDDSDDLVQVSVERALSRLHRWNEGTRLDSWMFKIMQNLWIDELRSRRSRGQVDTDFDLEILAGSDGRDAMDLRLTLQDTMAALMALPEEQRAVMLLVAVEGYSYRDAADVLDVPIGTVMSRISRARAALEQQGRAPFTVVEALS